MVLLLRLPLLLPLLLSLPLFLLLLLFLPSAERTVSEGNLEVRPSLCFGC